MCEFEICWLEIRVSCIKLMSLKCGDHACKFWNGVVCQMRVRNMPLLADDLQFKISPNKIIQLMEMTRIHRP